MLKRIIDVQDHGDETVACKKQRIFDGDHQPIEEKDTEEIVQSTKSFLSFPLDKQIQRALVDFRRASEEEIAKLKSKGHNLPSAINALIQNLRSDNEQDASFQPDTCEISKVMQLGGFSNEEDAVRALIFRDELVKLRGKGLEAPQAIDELTERMKVLSGGYSLSQSYITNTINNNVYNTATTTTTTTTTSTTSSLFHNSMPLSVNGITVHESVPEYCVRKKIKCEEGKIVAEEEEGSEWEEEEDEDDDWAVTESLKTTIKNVDKKMKRKKSKSLSSQNISHYHSESTLSLRQSSKGGNVVWRAEPLKEDEDELDNVVNDENSTVATPNQSQSIVSGGEKKRWCDYGNVYESPLKKTKQPFSSNGL